MSGDVSRLGSRFVAHSGNSIVMFEQLNGVISG